MYDVFTMGETMLRFTPPGFQRLEQSNNVEIHIGGSESNTAVGLARLGKSVCWFSRMTENAVGKHIVGGIASHGVDVSHVVWTDQDRVGTFYMEKGSQPRPANVIYDRADSAASKLSSNDLPTDVLRSGAKIFHTTGITLGISDSAREATRTAATIAKEAGSKISFDFNYRSKLWAPQIAARECDAFAQLADVLFIPIRDARTLFDINEPKPSTVLSKLQERWPSATIFLTLSSDGAMATAPGETSIHMPAFDSQAVERLGGGDAFSAGCLAGVLEGKTLDEVLQFGVAAAAIKYTIPGDLPVWERAALDTLTSDNADASGWR